MSIIITEIANGYVKFDPIWEKKRKLRISLVLTDPDGDVDASEVVLAPLRDVHFVEAIEYIAEKLDDLPHIRAWYGGSELSIGTASADYSVSVTLEWV